LLVTAFAFGTVSAVDVAALIRDVEAEALGSAVFLLLLPYALARWGSGREVAGGLGILTVPLALTAAGGDPAGDVAGGAVVLLLAVALGAGVRYQQAARQQELAGIRSRERALLARELHDSVAHHVSAIAIHAQAGRAVMASRPGAVTDALVVIEEEASRTLEEMRTMVGALRHGERPELVPQQGIADIQRLARSAGHDPRIELALEGDLDGLRPPVDAALYRIAQEAITNAVRHARHATVVHVRVRGDHERVRLTIDDDGDGGAAVGPTPGFGLVGMAERVKLLGGTFEAGPASSGGWVVEAVLPRHGAAT
jgi:signal transduction histidine kinase